MASQTQEGTQFIVSSWGNYNTTMTCTWQLVSQSTANNTSTIRLRHYFFYGGGSQTSGSGSSSYVMDGQTTTWNGYTIYPGYTLIQTKDITVTHNANGTFPGRNVSISASGYTSVAGCSGTATITGVPTISRAATINTFTGTDISKQFSATYTTNGSGFTYKLRISIPNVKALDTFTNYSSSSPVSLSKASIDYIKNYTKNKTIQLGGVIETWSGNTKIGESSEIKINCTIRREMYIKINGEYKRTMAYVRVGNEWKEARPYLRINNEWKEGI